MARAAKATGKTTVKKGAAPKKAAAKKPAVLIGEDQDFQRIRRITGYLVGTIDRWNNAKRAEERDRVKHTLSTL